MNCPFCNDEDFDAFGLKRHLLRGDCEPFEKADEMELERVRARATRSTLEYAPGRRKPRKRPPLSWCQQKIMKDLPDDGKWHDLMPDLKDWDTSVHFGPRAKATVIKGLISRGLIEHRLKNPHSPIAHLEGLAWGQIRKVRQSNDKDTRPVHR